MEKSFTQSARTFGTTFFSLYFPHTYPPFPLCFSPIRPLPRLAADKEEEKDKKEANSGQSVIFISKSFAPFVRNPKGTLQLFLSFSFSRAHFQILFLFTFAAAKVGSYSRPILSPGTFRSCLGTISLKQRNVARRYPEVSILRESCILSRKTRYYDWESNSRST